MLNRLSPHMRAFLLPVICILILLAVMWVPADAAEPRIIREISFVPCEGNPLYIFVFDNGNLASFDLVLVMNDEEVQRIFLAHLDKAKAEVKLAAKAYIQNCPKEGADI